MPPRRRAEASPPGLRADELDTLLLPWFARAQRDLPWRRTRDPYAVWVSEVMLQQTRVETVLAYFERWMQRFPTLEALAAASLDEVLKLWEGLGYYRRARNLHAAARHLAERGCGVPESLEEMLALKGVGRYTAGAVLSISRDLSVPIVDGNIKRVLCRLYAIDGDPASSSVERQLWALAESLLGGGPPSQHNQALMELGATVCTPHGPRCGPCPLSGICEARRQGREAELPTSSPRRAVPHRSFACVALREPGGRWLVRRRPEDGLLGGLWELPSLPIADSSQALGTAQQVLEAAGSCLLCATLEPVDHAFSHFTQTLHPVVLGVQDTAAAELALREHGAISEGELAWLGAAELDVLAWPVAQRKVLGQLLAHLALEGSLRP